MSTAAGTTVSIDHSLDAAELRALEARWTAARGKARDEAELRAIERGYEAHRARLFLENATLQADGASEQPEGSARLESNQHAIKASTVALAEVREMLNTP